jgi:hypothetical protein
MPFIGGKFYANPGYGKGVENARAAATDDDGAASDEELIGGAGREVGKGAVHRLVIEATEVVPAHCGRARSGFVVHAHRAASGARASGLPSKAEGRPETHVFTNHRDVADFVSGALGGE